MEKEILTVALLGDIVGRPGRRLLRSILPRFIQEKEIDFVVANGENSSGGVGIKKNAMVDLHESGVDVITSGNHIWNKKEAVPLLNAEGTKLVRPANYPQHLPGKGSVLVEKHGVKVGVVNLQGRVFMDPIDSPFSAVDREIETLRSEGAQIILVDFHAEATAEKEAMGFHLLGKASLLVGTHTHVQTSDERIYPEGLGYMTDLGRCGSFFSVLGVKHGDSLRGFLTSIPQRYTPAREDLAMEGLVAKIDVQTGKVIELERFRKFMEDRDV